MLLWLVSVSLWLQLPTIACDRWLMIALQCGTSIFCSFHKWWRKRSGIWLVIANPMLQNFPSHRNPLPEIKAHRHLLQYRPSPHACSVTRLSPFPQTSVFASPTPCEDGKSGFPNTSLPRSFGYAAFSRMTMVSTQGRSTGMLAAKRVAVSATSFLSAFHRHFICTPHHPERLLMIF